MRISKLGLLAALGGSPLMAQTGVLQLPSPTGGTSAAPDGTPAPTPPPMVNGITLIDSKPQSPLKPGSVEEAIATALKNHPDIKLAEAKRMVAEAELEQARLVLTQKVTTAHAKVQLAKLRLEIAEKDFARISERIKNGVISGQERAAAEAALLTAKTELEAANAELQAVKGGPAKIALTVNLNGDRSLGVWGAGTINLTQGTITVTASPEPGSVSDKLRKLLEKKITIDASPSSPAQASELLLKASGETGIAIRIPDAAKLEKAGPEGAPIIGAMKGEQTFQAWIQLVMDDLAAYTAVPEKIETGVAGFGERTQKSIQYVPRDKYEIYIRDYGLLVTTTKAAPAGALTLSEFAKQVEQSSKAKPTESKKP